MHLSEPQTVQGFAPGSVIRFGSSKFRYFFAFPGLFLVVSLPGIFPLESPAPGAYWMVALLASIMVLMLYVELIFVGKSVAIDLEAREVKSQSRTWLFRRRIEHYDLRRFSSIASHTVTHESGAWTVLELVTQSGGESFELLRINAPTKPQRFLSLTTEYLEPPACKEMREHLSNTLKLSDADYRDYRWRCTPVKPDKVSIR